MSVSSARLFPAAVGHYAKVGYLNVGMTARLQVVRITRSACFAPGLELGVVTILGRVPTMLLLSARSETTGEENRK